MVLHSNSQVLSCANRDRALTLENSRKLGRETSLSQHTLVQALLNVENVIMDVKDRQNCKERRTRSGQTQQFLHMEQSMEDIKGVFQNMRGEMQSANAHVHSTGSLRTLSASVRRGYASLSIEIEQVYVHRTISTLRALIRC